MPEEVGIQVQLPLDVIVGRGGEASGNGGGKERPGQRRRRLAKLAHPPRAIEARIEPELKQAAESVFAKLGMSPSDAIRIF